MLEKSKQTLLGHFSELLSSGRMESTRKILNDLHPSEIANLLESLPPSKRNILWGLLNPQIEGEVLLELSEEARSDLIDVTDPEELIIALKGLDNDELADLFAGMPKTVIRSVLNHMAEQDRSRLEQVMSYHADTAGGLMSTNTITIKDNVTLDIVSRYLRMIKKLPEHTDNLIIVDHKNHYLGTLSLSNLLTQDRHTLVKDLADKDAKSIPANLPASEVARIFEDFDLVSAPVIDKGGVLLGRITVDDVIDVIRKQAQEAEFTAAGLPAEENLFSPAKISAQRRSLWLGVNLVTAFFAAWAISLFQETLDKVIILAALIPVVTSMGGIAGGQTLVLIIRGLATGQVEASNTLLILRKELLVGIFNSIGWAVIVGIVTVLWLQQPSIGLIIAAAIIINLMCAVLVGVYIPIILKKFSLDPALGGNVLLTAVTDVIGIIAFLGIATAFML